MGTLFLFILLTSPSVTVSFPCQSTVHTRACVQLQSTIYTQHTCTLTQPSHVNTSPSPSLFSSLHLSFKKCKRRLLLLLGPKLKYPFGLLVTLLKSPQPGKDSWVFPGDVAQGCEGCSNGGIWCAFLFILFWWLFLAEKRIHGGPSSLRA